VQAATVGRKDLEASMASIKVAHDAALAERQREQKAFDAERAKHDTERKKLAEELSDLRGRITAAEERLKAAEAETASSKELHDRILASINSLRQRLSAA